MELGLCFSLGSADIDVIGAGGGKLGPQWGVTQAPVLFSDTFSNVSDVRKNYKAALMVCEPAGVIRWCSWV